MAASFPSLLCELIFSFHPKRFVILIYNPVDPVLELDLHSVQVQPSQNDSRISHNRLKCPIKNGSMQCGCCGSKDSRHLPIAISFIHSIVRQLSNVTVNFGLSFSDTGRTPSRIMNRV